MSVVSRQTGSGPAGCCRKSSGKPIDGTGACLAQATAGVRAPHSSNARIRVVPTETEMGRDLRRLHRLPTGLEPASSPGSDSRLPLCVTDCRTRSTQRPTATIARSRYPNSFLILLGHRRVCVDDELLERTGIPGSKCANPTRIDHLLSRRLFLATGQLPWPSRRGWVTGRRRRRIPVHDLVT